MKKIVFLLEPIILVLATSFLPIANHSKFSTVRINFTNNNAVVSDTFGIGIGYTYCIDDNPLLPIKEFDQPPVPPPGVLDARFINDIRPEPCIPTGLKVSYQAGFYDVGVVDTFEYAIQVANKDSQWVIEWDTTNISNKLNSLVITDNVTDGALLNIDMMTRDSIIITKTSMAKNVTGFYIYADWKPIMLCIDCDYPILSLNLTKIDFGQVEAGQHKDTVLTVKNDGSYALEIFDISSTSNHFQISGPAWLISPGAFANYTIRFSPDSAGSFSGSIIITSNSPTSPDEIKLSGKMVLGVPITSQLPHNFSLHQNYPNPFNPSTLIEYALSSQEFITLKVFNLLGQEIATLVEGIQDAGFKSVKFETKNLSSGVYIYRLTAGTFTDTKKMLLLR